MPLASGSRLGPYEIVGPLAAGGSGDVYRARDTRLDRPAALRRLPKTPAGDAEFKGRVLREARAIAALGHSHICAPYDIVEHDGAAYAVMPDLEGETLEARLTASGARQRLPIHEALTIALHIALAFEAADGCGIIHRDLKPGNVLLTRDGTAKVLDFGLTNTLAEAAADRTVKNRPITTASMVAGTAAYVSPEQARGRAVDKRTDVWSFGCVLFEMLSGSPAFGGETASDVRSAVLERDPDWSRLPHGVPRRIINLLQHCLQKDPKQRLHDIADARIEIEAALRADTDGRGDTIAARPPFARPLGWVVIVLLIAGNAFLAWNWMRSARGGPTTRGAPSTTLRSVLQLPADTALSLGRGSSIAFAPDGSRIVYTAESQGRVQLYLRSLDRFDATPMPGTDGAADPFFSPDGQWVGFFADRKLKKISIAGGAAVTVADAPSARGQSWGDDDVIVLTPRDNTGLWRVPAQGGKLEPVTTLLDGDVSHRWPQVLPDGKGLLYTIWGGAWEPAQIAVQPLDGSARRVLVTGGGHARFVSGDTADQGRLVYARPEGLMAVPFDLSRLEVTGQPAPVVDGVITNFSGGAQFAVSASGLLAYVSATGDAAERELIWVDRKGTTTPAATLRGMGRWYDLSPDGTRIVRYKTEGSTRDVWVEDLSKGTSTRISVRADPASAGPTDRLNVAWSADGRHIAYAAGLPLNLFRASIDGGGEERLTTSGNTQWPGSWSPDGKTLAFVEIDPLSGSDLWLLTLDEAHKPRGVRRFLSTPFSESAPMISPDGRWLAYQSNESGRYEIYVQRFPEGGRRWQVSTDEGVYPRWSPRSDELFFRSGPVRAGMASAAVKTGSDFQPGTPRVLFELRRYESIFEVAPDNARFLMMPVLVRETAATQVNLVVNWLAQPGARER